jgi:hypothetical protein
MAATLEVILKARDELTNVFKNTDVQFSKVALSANKLKTSFNSMLTVATGVAIGYGIKKITEESLRFADGIQKTSDMMNMSTRETQTWDYVMRQAGGSVTDLSSSMQRMQKLAYDASQGNKTAAEAFANLGVSIYDSNGALKLSGPLFADTVRALQNVSNSTERAGKTTAIFGRSAQALNPVLAMSNQELQAQIDNAEKYGQVLSDHAVKSIDSAGDAMENFNVAMKVASAEAISNAIPALESLAKVATKLMAGLSDAALGWDWLIRGKAEADKKIKESDAVTRDLQEWIKLKQEYKDVIATQESLRAKGGALFAPAVLAEAQEGLETVDAILKEINKSLAPTKAEPTKRTTATTDSTGGGVKTQGFNPAGLPSQMNIKAATEAAREEIRVQQEVNVWKEQNDQEQLDNARALWGQAQAAKQELKFSEIALQEEGYGKQLALLQENQMLELQAYDGNEAAITAIKQKHANERIALEEMQKRVNIQNGKAVLDNTVGNLKGIAGQWKQFAGVYKAIAIAQATWDTYSAAQSAYKAMAGIPYVGPALGAIAAGVAVAAGIANVKAITAAKFARGGDFVTTGPQLIMVGDNPGGRERVAVTPESSPNYAGPQGGGHTFIVNDYSGGFVETFRRDLRSGKADKLIADFSVALGLA